LRPSGAKGPLSVSVAGFANYQREEAWVWEHMALTRARVVYGSDVARREIEAIISDVLRRPRADGEVLAAATKMRADMAGHKPPKSSLDVKLGHGGLVDLEFAVHVKQLTGGLGFDPHLAKAIGALEMGGDMRGAHALLTRFLVTMRLVAPDFEVPAPATRPLVARACGADDWDDLLARLASARQSVAHKWQSIKGE
jgi:[glutamine synthetase] adenylyltransferase / [glutamine synthetase]-adenylyl-L-tyrosine phosphorylase